MTRRKTDIIKAADYFENEVYPLLNDINTYIYTLSGDPYLADDVTDDIMLMAWRYILDVHAKQDIKSYLMKCAKNRMFYYYRKNSRIVYVADPSEIAQAPEQRVVDALIELVRHENEAAVAEALKKLTQLERRIILMFYVYRESLKEIAEATGVTYNTVSTIKRRALARLAKEMGMDSIAQPSQPGRNRRFHFLRFISEI